MSDDENTAELASDQEAPTTKLESSATIEAKLQAAAAETGPLVWDARQAKKANPPVDVPVLPRQPWFWIAIGNDNGETLSFLPLKSGINELYVSSDNQIGIADDAPETATVFATMLIDNASGIAHLLASAGDLLQVNDQPIRRKHRLEHNDWIRTGDKQLAFVSLRPPDGGD